MRAVCCQCFYTEMHMRVFVCMLVCLQPCDWPCCADSVCVHVCVGGCDQQHSSAPLFTLSSSWYFMILWTGLMSRSLSCSLWPSCCRNSWRQRIIWHHSTLQPQHTHKKKQQLIANNPSKTIYHRDYTVCLFVLCLPVNEEELITIWIINGSGKDINTAMYNI